VAAIAGFLFFPKGRHGNPTSPGVPGGAPLFVLQDEKETHKAYGGSASCKECHEEEYEAWAKSHHGLAERSPDLARDSRAFDPTRQFQHGTQSTLTRKVGNDLELVTTGLRGTQEVFRVQRVIGEKPLQQFLVPFPGGRLQAMEACFDPRSNDWFNVYGSEDRKPGEWGHWTGRGMNWNTMCATCHNTRLRKNYDAASDAYHTSMVETGVGCESCHGPMKSHNEWQYANRGKGLSDPTLRKWTRDQVMETCAACHARRGEITGDPKPGESFFDHHLLSIVDESNIFHADGQVWDEDYEVTAFLGSRMFHKGVRCADCHNSHSARVKLPGNMMCLNCHGPGSTNAPAINPVTHSHHKVFGFDSNGIVSPFDLGDYKPGSIKETGGECVNCHMPQTVYMQRHWRHDHGFTIPDPLMTREAGIPNACNRCHQDKPVDWAVEHVDKWYGEKMNRPQRARARAVTLARRGEFSAREPLMKMLRTEEQDYWRAVSANLLEEWAGEPEVSAALVRALADTNALVRQSAVQSLSSPAVAARPDVREPLRQRLQDSHRNVRVVTAQALAGELNLETLAAQELRHMLAHNSDQPAGQMQLGLFQLARGSTTNALVHFQTAVRWDPYSPGLRHELAILLSQLGRSREALAELEQAVTLAPRDPEMRFKLALALNETGDSARVLKELETAAQLAPTHSRALYNLGLARNAAGDPLGALQVLFRAESSAPGDPQIPYARATILARMNRPGEARAAAQRALEIDRSYAPARELLDALR
jgi:Flp pilus assembly protein TadD